MTQIGFINTSKPAPGDEGEMRQIHLLPYFQIMTGTSFILVNIGWLIWCFSFIQVDDDGTID